uniref:Galactosyltransferase N-terminal domain-containing protein n=1 Tax=Esox lucius TaxID=8010 RepID=A0A3P8YUQ1_ESOLU
MTAVAIVKFLHCLSGTRGRSLYAIFLYLSLVLYYYILSNINPMSRKQRNKKTTSLSLRNWKSFSCSAVEPLRVGLSTPANLDKVRKELPHLQVGGRYKPDDCITFQKVAVIIPFCKRDEHLKFWLHYLHPILKCQQLDHGIYFKEIVSSFKVYLSNAPNNTASSCTMKVF